MLHDGEGNKASDLGELTSSSTKKSAHYYVDRAGHVYQLVDPTWRAKRWASSDLRGYLALSPDEETEATLAAEPPEPSKGKPRKESE